MKQLWTTIGAAALAVSLAGCGSDQAGNNTTGERPGDSPAKADPAADASAIGTTGQADQAGQASPGQSGQVAQPGSAGGSVAPDSEKATAVLAPTEGNEVSGQLSFIQADGGVQLQGNITGLTPGEHGFHVHEKGDCSAPDGKSAGGHYAPEGEEHGAPDASRHHTGDMGNITADESGNAQVNASFEFLSLSGKDSIVGKAVIVHGGKDDLSSQPSGDAGARVACGVIESAGSSQGGAGSIGAGGAGGNASGAGSSGSLGGPNDNASDGGAAPAQ